MGQTQKPVSRVGPSRLMLALSIFSAAPASAQQLTEFPVFHLQAPEGPGQGFAILNPYGTPHCLIVTVTHVVPKISERVEVDGVRISANSLQPTPTHTTATYLDRLADGLIVLAPADNANLGDCAPLTRSKDAERLLFSDEVGRLTYAERSGDLDTIRAIVDGDPRSAARLQVSSIGGRPIEPGLSGSPYTIGGQLIGVATSVEHGGTELIRLATADLNPRYLASLPPPPRSAPQWQPFDRSRLPKEYRDVSQSAYDIRQSAEAVYNAAERVSGLVDEAVAAAKLGAPGYGIGNITNTDRAYLGQVGSKGEVVGYGELRMLSGDDVGNVFKSYFKNDGNSAYLTGTGKVAYGDPHINNNKLIQWGEFYHSDKHWWYIKGPSLRKFVNGDLMYFNAAEFSADLFISTYVRASDGNVFENTEDPEGVDNGPGVRWSSEGQPLCICIWKKGQVISQWRGNQ